MRNVQQVRVDLISGAITTAIGSFWLWQARAYDYLAEGGRIAAGTLPAVAGLVMAVCGLGITAVALLRWRQGASDFATNKSSINLNSDDDQPSAVTSKSSDRKPLLLLASLVVCLLVVPLIGFAVAFALLTFVIVRVFERQSWTAAVLTAAGVWATSYLLFETLFQVPLP